MSNESAASGVNDFGLTSEDAVAELHKIWGAEDAVLSSPDEEENDTPAEADEDFEDAELSDESDEEDAVNETDVDEDEDEDETPEPAATELSDDHEVSFRFNGEDRKTTIGKLKRLAGLEQALDGRSKDLAELERAAKSHSDYIDVAASEMHQRALKRFEAWNGVDWVSLLKTADPDSFNTLRSQYEADHADVEYFSQTLDRQVQETRRAREIQAQTEVRTRVQNTIRECSDPETGIKGFGDGMLNDIGNYALQMGIPRDRMGDLFHRSMLEILHDGMMYRKGLTAATKPVVKTPKKILKGNVNADVSRQNRNGIPSSKAMNELERTGSSEAAVKALVAGWYND